MECPRSKKQGLSETVARLVLLCDCAEMSKKATFCICLPEFLNTVDSKWPFFGKLWWESTAMLLSECCVFLEGHHEHRGFAMTNWFTYKVLLEFRNKETT